MKRLALIAAAGFTVAGCGGSRASGPPPGQHQRPHYPVVVHSPVVRGVTPPRTNWNVPTPPDEIVSPPARLASPLATIRSATQLLIVTLGSSSCPSVPDKLVVENRHTIQIHLIPGMWVKGQPVAKSPGACTLDYGPTPMIVAIDPKLVDVHHTLTVRFLHRDSTKREVVTVAPLRGPHYPAVVRSPRVIPVKPAERNRLHIRGFAQFVSSTRLAIVTWGSGSCPEVPDKLTIVNPTTLRVHLAHGSYGKKYLVPHLPRNGICTTDLATTPMLLPIDPRFIDVHHPLRILGLQRGVVIVAPLKR